MKKIGLFYGTETTKTAEVGAKIRAALGEDRVEVVSVEKAWQEDFEKYDLLIVGVSTWFDGELPVYWDELIPKLKTLGMKGKQVAIFGLGDQKEYPDNFADGVGILADVFEQCGAQVVGYTSARDYSFSQSKALRGDQFSGLVLDYENQSAMTDQRIREWVEVLLAN